jgi:hypothetical protein
VRLARGPVPIKTPRCGTLRRQRSSGSIFVKYFALQSRQWLFWRRQKDLPLAWRNTPELVLVPDVATVPAPTMVLISAAVAALAFAAPAFNDPDAPRHWREPATAASPNIPRW